MTAEEAWSALREEVKMIRLNQEVQAVASTSNSSHSSESDSDFASSKRKKGMWDFAEEVADASSGNGNHENNIDEVDEYMKMSRIKKDEDPLKFWSLHSTKLPILSKLAKSVLSVPASSASVERLFSIAGAIARARRSSLLILTLKQILTYREYVEQTYGS